MASVATSSAGTSRVLLRDGSTAGFRPASPEDREAVRRFFAEMSPETRRLRFLGMASPSEDLVERLCDNSEPTKSLTLLVCRHTGDASQIAGMGSYFRVSDDLAEVAFAVGDKVHGKGIATALLELLARRGAEQDFESFTASVLPENHEMLDVFHHSGFTAHSTSDAGAIEVRLALKLSPEGVAAAEERSRLATVASLRSILRPKAVAVVGAARDDTNLGRRVFDSLLASGYRGEVYPVNPSVTELGGRRCYAHVRDLPTGVDLAVIAVPREAVLSTVDECAAIGVKGLVVISAGFAETDARGRELQAELVERVRGYGMRMVGPNCMGVINTNPDTRLNASFAESLPPGGRVALASQSGGLGLAVLALAARRRLGLSTFISLGNKADISGNDLLQYAERDPSTSVVLLYLESFGNPRRFGQIARRVARTKPIVVVKSGRTAAGLRAAASHTAGLAASDLSVGGLFRQAGVIRADTIDEMFDIAACLDAQPLPSGPRLAIVTNAGGPGILAADAAAAIGLEVPETAAGRANPIDLLASADAATYGDTVERLLAADDINAVIAIYTTIDRRRTTAILEAIAKGVVRGRARGATNKPVLVCTMASPDCVPLMAGNEILPVFEFPEHAARALGKVYDYATWRNAPAGSYPAFEDLNLRGARALCRSIARARGDSWLTPAELQQLLREIDVHPAPAVVAHSADEAAGLARVFGYPVAAKIVSPKALHKTELGAVRLRLGNEHEVRSAYAELSEIARQKLAGIFDGVLIQPMIADAVEVVVGLTQDPMFGPQVAFGLGGIYVDLFRDVAFRTAPLTDREADDMMRSVRGFTLLQGFRNQPPSDVPALHTLVLELAFLGAHIPELRELEFNPVMALRAGRGYQIVDARARVAPLAS